MTDFPDWIATLPASVRADAERLWRISPLFASLCRHLSDADAQALCKPLPEVQLPIHDDTWFPVCENMDLASCMQHLRLCKQRAMRTIVWWELGAHGDIADSYHAITATASALLEQACAMAKALLSARFGQLEHGSFCVIGLGKLGGRELNLGSDVDPLFIWQGEGNTVGGRSSVAASEYYVHLSRMLIKLMSERTEHGMVWPVDMRLRPGGDGAPICLSLDATLEHYLGYGQTWERAMLIKARPVAGDARLGDAFVQGIHPFVFRRYVDYTCVAALADMKGRIDSQAGQHGIEPGFDVKRGRGGIREIEFVIQSLQLLHAGRHPELCVQEGDIALQWLSEHQFMDAESVASLRAAYAFWRRCEHAIQARHGEQTHSLPEDYEDYLANALGVDAVREIMLHHAAAVRAIFSEHVLPDTESSSGAQQWLAGNHPDLLSYEPEDARLQMMQHLADMKEGLLRGLLPERSYAQVEGLLDVAMPLWLKDANGVSALAAFSKLLRNIAGRATWIDLLVTHRGVLMWLIGVLSASRYLSEHISEHPSMLEWPLANERGDVDISTLCTHLDELSGDMDEAELLAALSQYVDAARIQCALHVDAHITDVRTIGRWLADIADHVVQASFRWVLAQQGLPADFPMVAMAMGKHGSQEMGLASDLDMVFILAGDADETLQGRSVREWAQRVGRRVIRQLSDPAPFGAGYEFDARLRPSGNSGVLVTTLEGFRNYQLHEAQVWEHQALCRARVVSGPESARNDVLQVIDEVMRLPREATDMQAEVIRMRQKMLEHLASKQTNIINVKHDAGGLVDVEFLAQYARLMFGISATSTIDILQHIPASAPDAWQHIAPSLAQTYQRYRQMENALRVELWRSIGSLSTDATAEEWETMRRHTDIASPEVLQALMHETHAVFCQLMTCACPLEY